MYCKAEVTVDASKNGTSEGVLEAEDQPGWSLTPE